MPVAGTDLVLVERGGVPYKTTAQAVADLGAGGGGSDPWTYVKLASTFTTTSTDDTASGLELGSLAPDTHYLFEGFLFLQSAATATGARPGISWPGGTVQETAWMISPISLVGFASRFWGAPTTQKVNAGAIGVADESTHGRFEGQFITGASPTGALEITLATEGGGIEVRIMANSWLRWRTI
jgi:hypothetical protein